MQEPTSATVLGNFANATFTYAGTTTRSSASRWQVRRPHRRTGRRLRDYDVAYVFGVYPLQQYLIGFPDGRYQALSVAWDARPKTEGGQRWFHLYPGEKVTHRRRCTGRHQPELELPVRRLPFDQPAQGVRPRVEHVQDDVVGDRRLVRVLSRPGVGPRGMGRQARPRCAVVGTPPRWASPLVA